MCLKKLVVDIEDYFSTWQKIETTTSITLKRLSHRTRKVLRYETHSFQWLVPREGGSLLRRTKHTRSGELVRVPRSKFKIVQLLPLHAVTFPRATNRNGASKQAYRTPAKIFENSAYFALASVAQIALYLKGCAEPSGRRSACRVLCESRLTQFVILDCKCLLSISISVVRLKS